jgi:lactoylglutathione lyase
MLPIRGLYEVAIPVTDLPRAEAFYRDVPGLEAGRRDTRRPWLFLRAGGQAGRLVLQEDKGAWPTQHLAFTIDAAAIDAAAATLRKRGLTVRGPVFHAWMPAMSGYFTDPDGHQLELCAPTQKLEPRHRT